MCMPSSMTEQSCSILCSKLGLTKSEVRAYIVWLVKKAQHGKSIFQLLVLGVGIS